MRTDGDHSDALGFRPDTAEDPKTHIALKRANTIVVFATPPSYFATRNVFIPHMGQRFREADGKTVFTSMVTACSREMSKAMDKTCRAQAPIMTVLMRLDLILPRARMYDRLPAAEIEGMQVVHRKVEHVVTIGEMTFLQVYFNPTFSPNPPWGGMV